MIKSDRISLRELTVEDTQLIIKWRNSQSVKNNFIYRDELTAESHMRWFENKVLTGEVVQFIIIENESGLPIGSVYLRDIDHGNDKAEFGIFIGEESQRGKGYGKQAAALICRFGFEELGLNKITLRVFPFNVSAIQSYESVGFKQEAYCRQDVKINGKYEDMIHMALLASDKRAQIYIYILE